MPIAISYEIANDEAFQRGLDRVKAVVDDLRIPLTLIAKDFYKSERAIWNLKSPGLYPDLAPSTKKDRLRRKQPYYPILYRSGKLKASMLDPTDSNAVYAVTASSLTIGTRLFYGKFHQDGTKYIPVRKFLFIGPEAPRFATSIQKGRPERWLNILNSFILSKLGVPDAPNPESKVSQE